MQNSSGANGMSHSPWSVCSFGLSDIGLRQQNEDAWARATSKNPGFHVYAIGDGIGGRQAGEVASRRAVQRLCEVVNELYEQKTSNEPNLSNDPKVMCDLLEKGIQQVNQEVYKISQEYEFLQGMGTTLCALVVDDKHAYVAHVGDSRVYLKREGQLTQLTQDHKPSSASSCSHLVTRALGIRPKVQPTISWQEVKPNDLFMLCTDGVTNSLTAEQISMGLESNNNLKDRCQQLIEEAKEADGSDNMTTLLVHLESAIASTQVFSEDGLPETGFSKTDFSDANSTETNTTEIGFPEMDQVMG